MIKHKFSIPQISGLHWQSSRVVNKGRLLEGLRFVLRVVHCAESFVDLGHCVVAASIALLPIRCETTVQPGARSLDFQELARLNRYAAFTRAPVGLGHTLRSQVALLIG